jgi:23S rRNA pseudouridine1911/1915/1917 synthase
VIPRIPGEPPRDFSKPIEEVRVLIPPERAGDRLDTALARIMTWRSRTAFQALIEDGYVQVNDRPCRAATRVQPGDVVRLRIPPRRRRYHMAPIQVAELPVVYEDELCVALDKPANLPVHPAGRHLEGTVIHFLHQRYRRAEDPEADVVPRLMHRLDRETSGLLLASKDPDFHFQVGQQFERREVRKTYLAVVEGLVPQDEGVIDFGIGPARDSKIRLKMEARRDGSGLPALTWFKVLRRNARFSLVQASPRTGRQHQIRVHLAAIGHPVVGDKVYGPDEGYFLASMAGGLDETARARLVLPRQALHSHALTFRHPGLMRELTLTAPLAGDMAQLVPE